MITPQIDNRTDRRDFPRPAKSVKYLVLLLALAGVAQLAAADVYRWVEKDGTVNYGERKPHDREYTVISRSKPSKGGTHIVQDGGASAATAEPAPAAGTVAENDNLSDRQRSMLNELQAAERERQAALENIRRNNCATSKRVLAQMQERGRIRVRDENGEERAMTDEDRAERIRQAHQSIATNCDSLS